MITIDGSRGEGGGQILRSSLTLAMVSGQAVRLHSIRQGRAKPGLMRQHLTAVRAAARICGARVVGDQLHSTELTFQPGPVEPGDYQFPIGSAGSTTLVLQTVLPALWQCSASSRLTLEGGTHNPLAPPFEFFSRSYLPLVRRLGPNVVATLERHGFFPGGGGRITVSVEPVERLQGFSLLERGPLVRQSAVVLLSNLPSHIARRELDVVAERLGWPADSLRVETIRTAAGPGNVVLLEIESREVTELIVGFGQKGVSAEAVASSAADEASDYLATEVPVGQYLADQLIVPLTMAGGGSFRTLPLSPHARTQIDLARQFVDAPIKVVDDPRGGVRVTIGAQVS